MTAALNAVAVSPRPFAVFAWWGNATPPRFSGGGGGPCRWGIPRPASLLGRWRSRSSRSSAACNGGSSLRLDDLSFTVTIRISGWLPHKHFG